ncbi:carboxypeptidase-like regulatory domain-containing protein [Algoriphagus sediminis]|uniref:Carboxypeptidase-like regulatory domain-containing protein n=1 Tax=Algoriphagus sediminis TaxID=3057113 RepID=A0ABT7Y887_9BACT|nr:carboxypeptidase-like regulatory domain-containing protein [Algoriphagus sediminis]MDN3202733.1 carboxypeptidase-like regulatory domain-containing protein [Algoriphagus sediminis]
MLKKIYTYCFCLLMLAITSCEEQTFDLAKYGTISGLVVDGNTYEPLQGVQITTAPASTALITDASGAFIFDKVEEGDVVITARRNEYLTTSVSVAVFEGDNTPVTFFLLDDENNIGNVTFFDPVPGNGAVGQQTGLTLQWNVEQDNRDIELTYTVYLFESNSTVQELVGENLSEKEVIVADLKANTTYFWYVVGRYDGKNVANSPTWSFRTGS